MEISIIKHFSYTDVNCEEDYEYVTVEINCVEVQRYGDGYHDKGLEHAEGFTDGIEHILSKLEMHHMVDYNIGIISRADASPINLNIVNQGTDYSS